ncbi:MAG: hypothetical protein U9N59_14365 [Campylobacterota bacterium]|nr:hypothetical protein [Campylobacterota bacterium]
MAKVKSVVEYQKDMSDKTVITGFDQNNLKTAANIFDDIGIPTSKNSKIYGYTPQEITSMILGNNSEDIHQIWDSLVLDLILENKDLSYCYWSDKDIAYLLDYWTKVDSKLSFLFVYSHPKDSIKKLYKSTKTIDDEQIDMVMDEWLEYHQLLLKFFYKNLDKTLFFHIENARGVSQDYLEDLALKINLPKIKTKNKKPQESLSTHEDVATQNKDLDILYDSFANRSTKRYQKVIALYQEIQSVANFPCDTQDEQDFDALLVATKNIDKTLVKTKKEYAKLEKKSYKRVAKQINQKEFLKTKLSSVQEELEKEYLAKKDISSKAESKQKEIQDLKNKIEKEQALSKKQNKEQKDENELLLTQLFSVQEELEKEYLAKKDISSKVESKQKEIQDLKIQISQKEKETQELKAQQKKNELLSTQISSIEKKQKESEKQNKELKAQVENEKKKYTEQKEENELLLTQLFSVQEELEKYYLKSVEPKKKIPKNNGAVHKVKRQLKYKIGKKALSKQESFFGKVLLPISLAIVYMKHKEGTQYPEEFSYYDDVYEARSLKSGLEYTLGQNIKKDASGIFGLFKLPFVVSNTIKNFKEK